MAALLSNVVIGLSMKSISGFQLVASTRLQSGLTVTRSRALLLPTWGGRKAKVAFPPSPLCRLDLVKQQSASRCCLVGRTGDVIPKTLRGGTYVGVPLLPSSYFSPHITRRCVSRGVSEVARDSHFSLSRRRLQSIR